MVKFRNCIALALLVVFCVGNVFADLQADIKKVLAHRLLSKARVGIEIVRLTEEPEKCQVLYDLNSRVPMTPASNMKIITTSAALHVLSPKFRYRTMLLRHNNDLIIWGDGDPTLGDSELMDKIGWSQTAVFEDWAAQLTKRSLTTVENVIVDDSVFDQQFLHPRWEKHQFTPSGAEVGGLNFNANLVEFTVQERRGQSAAFTTRPETSYIKIASNSCNGGHANNVNLPRAPQSNDFSLKGTVSGTCIVACTIHDPGLYAGQVFLDLLKSKGFSVNGQVRRDLNTRREYAAANAQVREQWPVLCVFETPLASVVNRCNKDSMNLYAESLCKRMGAAYMGEGSWQAGSVVIGDFLKKLGVQENEFHLDDGSGLSRENSVTANAITRCLLHNFYSPNRTLFINSLPVGGIDGTLRKRFDGSLRGRVFAKTGFIANVSSLSGYLKTRNNEWYAFSILMNDIPDFSNSSIKPLQEQIVEALDEAASEN